MSHREEHFLHKPKYLTSIDKISQLSPAEREVGRRVGEKFVFRTNDYYQSLIDWDDPDDPIRKIVVPDSAELNEWGRLDASHEEAYTKVPGLEHKYADTALLLCNDVCGAYCRFCFRKRLFMDDNDEVVRDISAGLSYIRAHPEISNVLLTGGDPLIMSTSKLEPIVAALRDIPHVKIIRMGSKMPAFNPFRITNDPSLAAMFEKYSTPQAGRIYVMCHFNHPTELTPAARECLQYLQRYGVVTINQSPMIAGVNDDPTVLSELFDELSYLGVPPYYIFQCRPTEGNESYSTPLERAYRIFSEAQARGSGLAKRARFAMSHMTGKIEVIGLTDDRILLKYHRAADPRRQGEVMIFKRMPDAHWFDDYPESRGYTPTIPAQQEQALFAEPALAGCNGSA